MYAWEFFLNINRILNQVDAGIGRFETILSWTESHFYISRSKNEHKKQWNVVKLKNGMGETINTLLSATGLGEKSNLFDDP